MTLLSAAETLTENNTALAQGGIVYKGMGNDASALVRDILTAGWRQNYAHAVRFLARKGPQAVERVLMERVGVPFHRTAEGELALTREGGHSQPRILHCAVV